MKKDYRIFLILGIMCFGVSVFLPSGEGVSDTVKWLNLAITLVGLGLVLTGVWIMKKQGHVFADERFILHRLKATRFGLILGLIAILGLMVHSRMTENIIRWDLMIVLLTIAIGKIGAMVYYSHTG